MDCKECREWMSEALDFQLEDREAAFNDHLNKCEECRKEYEEYKMMMQAIHDLPDLEVPEGFRNRWQQAVKEEEKGSLIVLPLWRRRGFQMAVGIAAAALIAVNVPNVLRMGSQEMAVDEAPMEMAMEEPAAEPAMLQKDVGVEERGYGEGFTDESTMVEAPESEVPYEMASEDPVEESVEEPMVSMVANGMMPTYYVDESEMVDVRAFFEVQEAYLVELDEESEYPVYIVRLDAEKLALWEEFLAEMRPEAEVDKEDIAAGEASEFVEIRVEIME